MPESSKLASSKKTDKKSKRKVEGEDSAPAVEAPAAPSPSKGLKRKKSAAEVLDAAHDDETDKTSVKSRKKAKKEKEVEGEVEAPVEGKKKKSAKAAPDAGPAEPTKQAVEDDAPPKKTKKSKTKTPDTSVPEAAPTPASAESSTAPSEKPVKKSKKSKVAAPEPVLEPEPSAVEDALKPSKKPKKSKVEAPPEPESAPLPVNEDATMEVAAKPPKKSKKSKPVAESEPEPIPVEEVAAKPLKKSKKSKPEPEPQPEPEPIPAEEEEVANKPSKKTKKSKPEPVPEPESEPISADEAEDSDEDAPLHGFSTDDDDSSDDDGYMDVEVSAFDVAKLPTIAKDDATVKRKLENAKRQPTADRGVLFLGRIPHGFYEDQLKAYFAQFGNVTRLRVSRNKKTGQSKHYGFIEFDSSSVAQIVADTMDNYLLMGHIMRCKVIPKDQVHPELWVGANRRWRPVPKVRVAQTEHNKLRTKDEQMRAAHRLLKRQEERQRKLEKAGITYDFGAAGYKLPKAVEA